MEPSCAGASEDEQDEEDRADVPPVVRELYDDFWRVCFWCETGAARFVSRVPGSPGGRTIPAVRNCVNLFYSSLTLLGDLLVQR